MLLCYTKNITIEISLHGTTAYLYMYAREITRKLVFKKNQIGTEFTKVFPILSF
jgi:hypothetical protein